jgi:GDP-D-mannose 3', 5'-epimerase
MAVVAGKHEIEIWGDGEQTRSFMYIDDCLIWNRPIAGSTTKPRRGRKVDLISPPPRKRALFDRSFRGSRCPRTALLDPRGRNVGKRK